MGQRQTVVSDLCKEVGVTRQTLYRHLGPDVSLREDGQKMLDRYYLAGQAAPRTDPDSIVRAKAKEAIARLGISSALERIKRVSDGRIKELIATTFRAPDPHDRAKAAEQLGEILPGPKEGITALRKALSLKTAIGDPLSPFRHLAASSYNEIGCHQEGAVRGGGNSGPFRLVRPLTAAPTAGFKLSDDPHRRVAVASALAKIILETSMEEKFDLPILMLVIVYCSSGIETRWRFEREMREKIPALTDRQILDRLSKMDALHEAADQRLNQISP